MADVHINKDSASQPQEISIEYTVDCVIEREGSNIDLGKNGEKSGAL